MRPGADHVPAGRRDADRIITAAIADMEAAGVPVGVAIDRLLTFGAYMAFRDLGADETARQLASMADLVGEGLFDGCE